MNKLYNISTPVIIGYHVVFNIYQGISIFVITYWNNKYPMDSIVVHYGIGMKGKIYIETIYEFWTHTSSSELYINTNIEVGNKYYNNIEYRRINLHNEIYEYHNLYHDIDVLTISKEFELGYISTFPVFDFVGSNCQHFVNIFMDIDYPTQSELVANGIKMTETPLLDFNYKIDIDFNIVKII